MKIESLHIGMKVRHLQYGVGTVKSIGETTAEVRFADSTKVLAPDTAGLEPAEAQVSVTALEQPLAGFVKDTVQAVIKELGLQRPDDVVEQLGKRWHNGRVVLQPADPSLQPKEIPLEVFFHKIVMVRNNLRVLEQKVNAHEKLSEADKLEMQQYITRSYGSLTTFNLLFADKENYF
ncbi:MAG: hypothetical protein AB1705_01760 [Verrucomicrobiota bacterium]